MKTELKRNHFQQLVSKQHSYKLLSLIACLLLSVGLKAQTVTINVETAGTLSSLIASSKKYLITNLKLTGNLNGTDIRYIREMAGINYWGSGTEGKLATLDLSDANILSGGDYYLYYRMVDYSSENNKIGAYMFNGCTSLASITIPNNVTSIGDCAFSGCTSLASITIPNNVKSIRDYAFLGCANLASITIPNNVTSIGYNAFYGCTSLASVNIPNSVTSIGNGAFRSCTSLTSVTIPNSVTSIGDGAFNRCTSLTSVNISNSMASLIGDSVFSRCTSLASVTIGNSVTSIENYAFYGCTSLASVTIGNSVTSIGDYAFYGCTKLNKFIVPNENANYSAIDGVLFNKNATTLISYPNTKDSTYTIPNSVTSIGSYAFRGCTKLAEIHCKTAIPIALTPNATCFSDINKSTCKLYVPRGSFTVYWYASVWGDFINIIEEDDTDGINTITSDDLSISSSSEGININSNKAIEVSLYNVNGQCVYKGTVSGEVTIPLENGLYIAKVGDKTFKVQK